MEASEMEEISSLKEKKKEFANDNSKSIESILSSTGFTFKGERIRKYRDRIIDWSEDKSNLNFTKKNFFKNCEKFGVVTTIFDPTIAVKRVSKLNNWCVVIVADKKTPTDYMDKLENLLTYDESGPFSTCGDDIKTKSTNKTNNSLENIFFFGIEEQLKWESKAGHLGAFFRKTPWNHFARKNLGYLFALINGAKVIFDFDDDNYIKLGPLKEPLNVFPFETNIKPNEIMIRNVSVPVLGSYIFNHHKLMRPLVNGTSYDGSTWARGFPLNFIMEDEITNGEILYHKDVKLGQNKQSIGVIQYLADGNPDVDAIHRLSKPLPMNFDFSSDARPILVPKHAYAPYNAQATIHTYNAFWATLLPITVPGRVSDIWRSYFSQCLFADSDLRVIFAPPKIMQCRVAHDYLGDFQAEQDLYSKSGKLLEYLSNWDMKTYNYTHPQFDIPHRMQQLWINLYEHGYIEKDDVFYMQEWIGTLLQFGYTFPKLKPKHRNVAVMGQFNFADNKNSIFTWVQKQREQFKEVLVAGSFPHKIESELVKNSIPFIQNEKVSQPGFIQPYENLAVALQRYKNSSSVESVMYLHDDFIVNLTEASQGTYPFPTNEIIGTTLAMTKLWLSYENPRKYIDMTNKSSTEIYIAKMTMYKIFTNGTISDIEKHRFFQNSNQFYADYLSKTKYTFYRKYLPNQIKLTSDPDAKIFLESDGSMIFPAFTQADFLFVPTKYADTFSLASKLHAKHGIWLEIAIPKIVDMIRQKHEGVRTRTLRLCTVWFRKRKYPFQMKDHCLGSKVVIGGLHPAKIDKNSNWNYSPITFDTYNGFDTLFDAMNEDPFTSA
ncbi:hypothetical protein CTEN210_18661 [Chaetoceros tenuissimus]|uniref:Uncharacterized protein n=1 Tax=Chaetoceros tenuissimus TaxID=426638 RepID=A0AAD3DFP7_9STRA|nr:hypothetical protein CTEN210_18661 [Chaetoceros tenuissimus]